MFNVTGLSGQEMMDISLPGGWLPKSIYTSSLSGPVQTIYQLSYSY